MVDESVRRIFVFDKDWKLDLLIGFGMGIVFLLLITIIPSLAVGIPLVEGATAGERAVVVNLLAPIGEEFIISALWIALALAGLPLFFIFPVLIGAFSIYHVKAYAGSFALQNINAVSAMFVGALIFGAIARGIHLWRKNPLAPIAFHFTVNAYLWGQIFATCN